MTKHISKIILEGISTSDLLEDIRALVRQEIEATKPPVDPFPEYPTVMYSSHVEEIFDKSKKTINDWAKHGQIPATKIGRNWVFNKADIIEHLNVKT